MAARAIWKAVLNVGSHEVPVKLYSAVEDRNIHFNLLHDQDYVRVKQRMVHPVTDETVPYSNAQRGVEVSSTELVLLSSEELDELEPEPSRDVTVGPFVPKGAIPHQQYDRPYYLGPDGSDAEYFALAAALSKLHQEGIARWTMRKKQYIGVVSVRDDYLVLITLRHTAEVIEAAELTAPEGRQFDKKEHELAGRLIEALTDDFNPSEYRDTYRERVAELIAAKQRGETFQVEKYQETSNEGSLSDALQASLKAMAH